MDVPVPILDREIAAAAGEVKAARRELATGAEVGPPLWGHRRVSSRTTFLELSERGDDPLAAAARDWVLVLTLERVLWADTTRLAAAWHAPTVVAREPERGEFSPREVRRRILGETSDPRRRAWGRAFADGAGTVGDRARILAERRAEAAALLDPAALERLELPVDPPGSLAATASLLLERTSAMLPPSGAWPDAIEAMLARDAARGWPAHLGARWLEDVLGRTGFTDGLTIRLGPLPQPLGAASFARALGAVGAAIAAADGPASAPFSMRHPPFDVRAARRAALFASLAADPVFAVRALGLGRDAAREQARRVARALLASLRLDAARVLLRGALVLAPREREERFEEATARALGAPIPPPLAGVLPLLSADDPTRLVGSILAAADRRRAIERFDEDWFANPAAAEALRGEDSVLAAPRVGADAVASALEILVADASALLS